jgi:hypothetical protein
MGTYQRVTAGSQDGLVTRGTLETIEVRTIRGGVATQPESLTRSIELSVMDGRGGADSHDAEVGVGIGIGPGLSDGRGGSRSQKRQSKGEKRLHYSQQ